MHQAAIILIGNKGREKKSVRIARKFFQSGLRSHTHHSSSESFAVRNASGLVKKDSMEKTTQSTERKREEEIAAVLMRNGYGQFSAEIRLRASIAARKTLNCTLTISSLLKILLPCALKSVMDLRSVSSVIGRFMLRKMKRRLIRWNPDQIMLRTIPSQACRETCLKV